MEQSNQITQAWLDARGDLDDARIVGTSLSNETLLLYIDDEWANEEGLPGYPGPRPGALEIASLVEPPKIDPDTLKERISDIDMDYLDGGYVKVTVICFGQSKIVAVGRNVRWINGATP
jgi:hypothetical protein